MKYLHPIFFCVVKEPAWCHSQLSINRMTTLSANHEPLLKVFCAPGNDLQPLYINILKKRKGATVTHRTARLALRCIQPPVH